MDDDVKQAIDELRQEIRDAARARTPRERREADADVASAREDLEHVLRREGYRLSRRELDAIIEERDAQRQREQFEKWYEEKKAEDAAASGDEEETEEEGDEEEGDDGEKKKTEKKKTEKKKTEKTGDEKKAEDEEWV